MNARTALLLAPLALAARDASAGEYGKLRGQVEAYTPPAVYRALVAPGAPAPAAPPAAADETAFRAAAERVRQLGNEWDLTLQAGSAAGAFLVPDAERLRALAGAAGDATVAARALADGFPLENLETLALVRSPQVAARASEARAAREVFSQAELIDVVLRSYASLTPDSMTGFGGMGTAPDFPFPSILALKGRIVGEEMRAANERLEAARRDAVTAARRAYWELGYLVQSAETTARMSELLEDLSRSVAARYEAGQTSFQDVVRVRIEREKIREELRTLVEERRNQEAEVRGLLALPPEVAVGAPATREPAGAFPPQVKLEALALSRRQELLAADAMVARMELMQEMVETMTYPGFALGIPPAPREETAPATGGDGMGGSTGSPGAASPAAAGAPQRPLFGGDEAYLREIRQRVAGLRSEREATRAETLVGVRAAWFAADRARREEALYATKVVGLSQSALEASLEGYAAGKVAFSDLLESYTGWFEASLARQRARADIGVARAALQAAVGFSHLEVGND